MRLRALYHLPGAMVAIVVYGLVGYLAYRRTRDGFQALEALQAFVGRYRKVFLFVSHFFWLVIAAYLIFNH